MPPLRRPGACGAGCHRPPCGAECHWRSRVPPVPPSGRGSPGLPQAGDLRRTAHNVRRRAGREPRFPLLTRTKYAAPRTVRTARPGGLHPWPGRPGERGGGTRAEPYGRRPPFGGTCRWGAWTGRGARTRQPGPPRPRRVPVARGGRPITAREHGPWTAARRMRPTAPGSVRTGLPRPVRNTGAGRTGSGRWPFCCPAGPVRRCAAADRGGRPGVGGLLSYTRSRYPFFAPCLNLPRVLSPSCGPAVALPWPSARIGAPSPHA